LEKGAPLSQFFPLIMVVCYLEPQTHTRCGCIVSLEKIDQRGEDNRDAIAALNTNR
jgi:hypothetical protein